MRISIVIPNFNGVDLLKKNLPELLKAKAYKKNNISEIIIVDDKSTDASLAYLRENFKDQVRVIAHTKNRGFSAAVNTGARSTSSELICLLNTDVTPSENFLENIIPHFKDKKVFAVSLHERGYGPSKGRFEDGYIVHSPEKEKKTTTNTFWVSGGSGVFRRSVWMKLGGMNEVLYSPYYWEDVDLAYAALKRGFVLLWEPRSTVVHEHEATIKRSKKTSLIQERNQLLFNWKNLTSSNLRRKHFAGLIKRIRQHPGYLRVVIMALGKYKIAMKLNKKELRESTVSDEAIFNSFE